MYSVDMSNAILRNHINVSVFVAIDLMNMLKKLAVKKIRIIIHKLYKTKCTDLTGIENKFFQLVF